MCLAVASNLPTGLYHDPFFSSAVGPEVGNGAGAGAALVGSAAFLDALK